MQIDPELEAIKARVKEMEEEAEKIKQMQTEVDKQMAGSTTGLATVPLSLEEKQEIDTRSVYVGNVDYGASAEELEAHFHGCGTINRVTILCNKADGHPKGFAYIEFGSKEYVETALAMNETLFRGRQIKVNNIHIHNQTPIRFQEAPLELPESSLYQISPQTGSTNSWLGLTEGAITELPENRG